MSESDLSGMTVNERLFHCGLMEEFDRAKAAQDKIALRKILARIELPDYPIEDLSEQ